MLTPAIEEHHTISGFAQDFRRTTAVCCPAMGVRTLRLAANLASGLAAVACGSHPTANQPTPTAQFVTGAAAFQVFSDERSCTEKTPAWGLLQPRGFTPVTVVTDGSGWTGTADAQRFGDGELKFRQTSVTQTQTLITGTARGTLIDSLSVLTFPNPSRVTFNNANLTGTYLAQPPGAIGQAAGTIVYTDNQGGVTTCTAAVWSLFPVQR